MVGGIVASPEFAARVEGDGGRPMLIAPGEQTRFMRDELERWSRLVKQYGVTVD